MKNFVLTSTSVTGGHPDKLCDRISDAVVDAYLASDPRARVSSECAIASGIVFIATRADSDHHVDFPAIVRGIIAETGYRDPDFAPDAVTVLSSMAPKSGIDPQRRPSDGTVNATLFGYACRHTPELMPMSIALAHRLTRRLSEIRISGRLPALHPDGQAQVAVRYVDRKPVALEGITLSTSAVQAPSKGLDLDHELRRQVIAPIVAETNLPWRNGEMIAINPDGVRPGGPNAHAGLTGRKNDIDTYGGYSRHAGPALSGKDPSRIDRTGAYLARFAARTVVAAGVAEECEVQISYARGRTKPISIDVDSFGSGQVPDDQIERGLARVIDFDAVAAVERFGLADLPHRRGGRFFTELGAFGHVGRSDLDLPWETGEPTKELVRTFG